MSEDQPKSEQEKSSCGCGSSGSSCIPAGCCPFSNIDWKGIYEKVFLVTTKPVAFFEQEKLSDVSIVDLYKKYFLVLAAITPIFSFIKFSIIGVTVFGATVRTPVFSGLVSVILQYILNLVFLFLFAYVIEQIAKHFGGTISRENAFKLFAFSLAPAYVAGALVILGPLGILASLVGIYSIYIFYLGSPIMGACTEEKKITFTAAVVISFLVVSIIAGVITAFSTPDVGKLEGMPQVNFNLNVPQQAPTPGQ